MNAKTVSMIMSASNVPRVSEEFVFNDRKLALGDGVKEYPVESIPDVEQLIKDKEALLG